MLAQPYTPPYFLMVQDHPGYYYMPGIELCDIDIEGFLRNPSYTDMEKRLAVFAMQKLSVNAG